MPVTSAKVSVDSSPKDLDKEEMERCPHCWKLFPVHNLPLHSPMCQDSAAKRSSSTGVSPPPAAVTGEESAVCESLDDSVEQCPHCLAPFPLDALVTHAETCSMASSSRGSSRSDCHSVSSGCAKSAKSESPTEGSADVISLSREVSLEQCPICFKLMPLTELITHSATCRLTSAASHPSSLRPPTADLSDTEENGVVCKRAKYTLEAFEKSSSSSAVAEREGGATGFTSRKEEVCKEGRRPPDGVDELEQCVHCLKEFPISEIVRHATSCSAAARGAAGSDVSCSLCRIIIACPLTH